MGKPIAFIPGKKYPSISITGRKCWLMCSYCWGRYLGGMIHVEKPEELYSIASKLYMEKAYGMLISGGFTRKGYLPVEPYIPIISSIKKEYGLILSIHPGLVERDLMIALRDAGVDIVDYELVLDSYILRILKHLEISVEDHIRHFKEMIEYGPPHVIPHIPLGFTRDDQWVYEAIELLKEYDPEIIVFLVNMGSTRDIIDRVVRVLEKARSKLSGEISLGCMRPFNLKKELDRIVIERELVDRIVNPLREHIRYYGLRVVETCCSVPRELLGKHGLL